MTHVGVKTKIILFYLKKSKRKKKKKEREELRSDVLYHLQGMKELG